MPTTTNFGWTTPADTDLVKDGASAIRTLGNGIDTSLVDLKGGTTGQVLSKATNTDMDFTWVTQDDANAIQNAIVDAKGDVITATAADTPARLAVGTNGQVLTADSTTSTGLKWATPAAGGKVLQVVSATTTTSVAISSDTMTDTGISASITPTAATSKILVLTTQQHQSSGASNLYAFRAQLLRGATQIAYYQEYSDAYIPSLSTGVNGRFVVSTCYLDSPNTTSSTTYKMQARRKDANSGTITFNENSSTGSIILLEIGA